MRRKRNARLLFWPSLAAIVVTLILLLATRGREQSWIFGEFANHDIKTVSTRLEHSSAIKSYRKPSFLAEDSIAQSDSLTYDAPKERRAANFANPHQVQNETESLLVPPSEPIATVSLRAPIRTDNEELAGLSRPATLRSNDLRSPFRTASTLRNGGTADLPVNRVADRSSDKTSPLNAVQTRPSFPSDDTNGARIHFDDRSPYDSTSPQPDDSLRQELKPTGAAWPRTPALDADLLSLDHWPATEGWVTRVHQALVALQAVASISDPRAGSLILELEALAQEGIATGEGAQLDRQFQESMLRTSHALLRRTVVWKSIWRLGDEGLNQTVSTRSAAALASRRESVDKIIEQVREHIAATGDVEGWSNYLLVNDIERLANEPDAEARRLTAQRLLSRVHWDGLSEDQVAWLDHSSLHLLTARVRPWTDTPVDYTALLAQLERQEADALDLGSIDVATAVQALRFSEHRPTVEVAEAINNYYRNANIRFAVSADLLKRLIPPVPNRTQPIRHTVVGLPVRGIGEVESELNLQLVPATNAWHLQLQTLGTIHAKTGSQRGPVRVSNVSNSHFNASTPIVIDRNGVRIGETEVAVNANVQLAGMRTDFDGFPVIGSLIRGIAMSQYESTSGQAKKESECLMRRDVESSIAKEVQQQVQQATQQLSTRLLGPLGNLELAPLVVDLGTSDSRLAVRYRVSGDWQLAAFTPRPRAISDSVLSMQVHQSTLNNTFERLAASETPRSLRDIALELVQMFGATPSLVPDDIPSDVRVRFAATRPITVEMEDDLLWLTLRIVRLENDNGLELTNFVVRASYRAQIDGLHAVLVRDGVLHISGPRMGMRERLPIRAVFNKVLNSDHVIPLVSQSLSEHPAADGLRVSQLELIDGWLGMSISPRY